MIIRKAFFYWQLAAVVLLPLWLVVGWPIFGGGGWSVLGVFFGAVVLGVGMLVVSGLLFARKEVRERKALSWADVGVLALWHALIITVGFYGAAAPWLSVVVIVVGVGAFWFAVWELLTAAKRRVRSVIDYLDESAKPVYLRAQQAEAPGRPAAADAEVIVIREKPAEPDRDAFARGT